MRSKRTTYHSEITAKCKVSNCDNEFSSARSRPACRWVHKSSNTGQRNIYFTILSLYWVWLTGPTFIMNCFSNISIYEKPIKSSCSQSFVSTTFINAAIFYLVTIHTMLCWITLTVQHRYNLTRYRRQWPWPALTTNWSKIGHNTNKQWWQDRRLTQNMEEIFTSLSIRFS